MDTLIINGIEMQAICREAGVLNGEWCGNGNVYQVKEPAPPVAWKPGFGLHILYLLSDDKRVSIDTF